MNKQDLKEILFSIKSSENESLIGEWAKKIDDISNEKLKEMLDLLENKEENIKNFFEKKLSEKQNNHSYEHLPINEIFSYGIKSTCVHLHVPVDLRPMIAKIGLRKTMATVNLSLLDAIEKIKEHQNDTFNNIDSIYMISPILLRKRIKIFARIRF